MARLGPNLVKLGRCRSMWRPAPRIQFRMPREECSSIFAGCPRYSRWGGNLASIFRALIRDARGSISATHILETPHSWASWRQSPSHHLERVKQREVTQAAPGPAGTFQVFAHFDHSRAGAQKRPPRRLTVQSTQRRGPCAARHIRPPKRSQHHCTHAARLAPQAWRSAARSGHAAP